MIGREDLNYDCNIENKLEIYSVLKIESITKQLMGGGAKRISNFGTEVVLVPLIESESAEGGGRECFRTHNKMS